MQDKEIATFVEEIKKRTISAQFMEFNYFNNNILCPICGKDTAETFDSYKGGEIFCDHCRKNLSLIDFYAKSKFKRTADKFSPAEYKGLIATICGYLGIETNFKSARADETTIADKKLLGANMYEFFQNSFPAFVAENQKFQDRKTGFCNLDDEQNFQAGIYVLGGLPALGKTTFALQLLNQLAKQGETCIFCSYEMSAGYLYSKLLAQEIFLIESGGFNEDIQHFNKEVQYPLTTSKIVFGNFKYHEDAKEKALKNFAENPLPLYIWEIADLDLNKLLNRIKQICASLDKPPVICIDYLQLLAAGSENTKTALDNAIHKLFNFRRETNATFIVISSLNRANYQTEISFESFKESGSIEYSADVIWGLQLLVDGERTRQNTEKAKRENHRRIQLKCLKNRFGSNFDIGFFYYPDREIFTPMFEYGAYTDKKFKSAFTDEGESL
jgi:replicative DNA helicase